MEREIQAAKDFSRSINDMMWRGEDFAEEICCDHRHLQHVAFITFMKCIETWANMEKSGIYDGRNEYAVKTSRFIIDAMKDFKG